MSEPPIGVPNLVHIRPRVASGRMGAYNYFLSIYSFLGGIHLQVRRVDGFSRMMVQTSCAFLGFVDIIPQ